MMRALEFMAYKAERDAIIAAQADNSARWQAIPGNGSGAYGLTPDSVKRSPEWQACYAANQRLHNALRRLNGANVKRFAVELRLERDAMRAGRLASAI